MPGNDDILSRIGHALQSAWGNDSAAAAPRSPRSAEISSGVPLTTKTADPGTSRVTMQVASHGYFPEKAQRTASDQEVIRYTRAQQDDIKAAEAPAAPQAATASVTPEALAAALAFLQGRGR